MGAFQGVVVVVLGHESGDRGGKRMGGGKARVQRWRREGRKVARTAERTAGSEVKVVG